MAKRQTSLYIEEKTYQKFKLKCLKENIKLYDGFEDALKMWVAN